MFGGMPQFNQPVNRIGFAISELIKPLPDANLDLYNSAHAYGKQLLGLSQAAHSFTADVAKYIAGALQRGEAFETRACAELGVSPRTMQRNLASEGTTFKTLMEETRMQLARHYLADTDLSLTAIAFMLGYSELSAFSRAAKAWHGDSPSMLRKKLAEQALPELPIQQKKKTPASGPDRRALLTGADFSGDCRVRRASDREIVELGALLQAIDQPVWLAAAAGPGIGLVLRVRELCSAERLALAGTLAAAHAAEQFIDREAVILGQFGHFFFQLARSRSRTAAIAFCTLRFKINEFLQRHLVDVETRHFFYALLHDRQPY